MDDNPENLRFLAEVLTKQGYKVRVVQDSRKALSIIQDILPDLILLDIMMPGLDGYQYPESEPRW